ncbi:unnamed protein product [marine sediment metagenome]|uniref:Uncharacterized protein n=1 Tax=marine sediment metagenome TaxID=412755 RepID=X1C0A8_9ZZZZ
MSTATLEQMLPEPISNHPSVGNKMSINISDPLGAVRGEIAPNV